MTKHELQTFRIRVTGLVQGVGFRPFIYRTALQFKLNGTVDNRNDGVQILVNCDEETLINFEKTIVENSPEASQIFKIFHETIDYMSFSDFRIVKSSNNLIADEITEISPDIAVCDNCMTDLKNQTHRLDYPFINCTNCGPRFTIIQELPYDRPFTTMSDFEMCPTCKAEYSNVSDRRFHAQPVACNNCGPTYNIGNQQFNESNLQLLFKLINDQLKKGGVIALKSLGGYNLVCDAENEVAVKNLRASKHRDGKPLAVMFKNIEVLNQFCIANEVEIKTLKSFRRPILILKTRKNLASGVSLNFKTTGAMLPYLPFHHLLFENTNFRALVMTSANISGEPIIIDDKTADQVFGNSSILVISYNRAIYNRVDDSVAMVANDVSRLIRRSRGFAPSPIRLDFNTDGILSVGAELVNTFCIGRVNQAIMSQHIGDLKNAETLEFFEESIKRYKKLFKLEPSLVVHDLHPDYISSRYAQSLNINTLAVQHHHSHLASVLAENGLDQKVIGVIYDGTGLGTDGKIWGSEFFIADFEGFERVSHFGYVPIPGGDIATKEPWRIALSYLHKAFGINLLNLKIPFVKNLDVEKSKFIITMIEKGINSPESCSAGRLFDAVSALTSVCENSNFHAEAPMRLEDILDHSCIDYYPYQISEIIEFNEIIKAIVIDLEHDTPVPTISAKFHNTIVNITVDVVANLRRSHGINHVALSGGTFQNKYLLEKIEDKLKSHSFEVYSNIKVPANDGGISLGQLAIASKLINNRVHFTKSQ